MSCLGPSQYDLDLWCLGFAIERGDHALAIWLCQLLSAAEANS